MAFWSTFAKILVKKAAGLGSGTSEEHSPKLKKCISCGRPTHPDSLEKGKCFVCRLDQWEHEWEHKTKEERPKEKPANSLNEAYRVLDCKPSDSDEHIKKRYRQLIKECHVDSLPKNLPDYLVQAANRRFHEIQTAYENIENYRKSKN